MKKINKNDVLRETLLKSLNDVETFNDYYCFLRSRFNHYFKFSVNGKFVGFSGLVIAIQDSLCCSLEMALFIARDLYRDVIYSTTDVVVRRCLGLKIKLYAK